MNKLAIFASGSGTNAMTITEYFKNRSDVKVDCILTNNPKAFVLERFKESEIAKFVFNKEEFYKSSKVLDLLRSRGIDFIALAGFLWLVPKNIISAYNNRMINIHPSLLPKYGGKGMYGIKVHEAVINAGERETGITIHYVNNNFDEGNHIFQAKCTVEGGDSAEDVAQKVHQLEYQYYPKVIDDLIHKL